MDACPFPASHAPESKRNAASIGGETTSVEISVTSFLVTSSLATQGTLRISSQVAGSGGRPLSDA